MEFSHQNQSGMSLLSTLMAIAISGVVVLGTNQILQNALDLERAFDAKATRDDIVTHYYNLMRDRNIAKAVEAHNPDLQIYVNSTENIPNVTHGPLEIVTVKGMVHLPAAGKYLDVAGGPASPNKYFWHVSATWTGKSNTTYEINISARRNPEVKSWGQALTSKVKTAMNATELSCSTVIGKPVLGPEVAGDKWMANIGFETWTPGNHGKTSRPRDSSLTVTRVTCPAGTRLSGIRAWGSCGSNTVTAYSLENNKSIPSNLRSRMGECKHFMGTFTDPNCTQWLPVHNYVKEKIWGVKCEATCCTFPQ